MERYWGYGSNTDPYGRDDPELSDDDFEVTHAPVSRREEPLPRNVARPQSVDQILGRGAYAPLNFGPPVRQEAPRYSQAAVELAPPTQYTQNTQQRAHRAAAAAAAPTQYSQTSQQRLARRMRAASPSVSQLRRMITRDRLRAAGPNVAARYFAQSQHSQPRYANQVAINTRPRGLAAPLQQTRQLHGSQYVVRRPVAPQAPRHAFDYAPVFRRGERRYE